MPKRSEGISGGGIAASPPTRSIFASLKWIDLPALGEVKVLNCHC